MPGGSSLFEHAKTPLVPVQNPFTDTASPNTYIFKTQYLFCPARTFSSSRTSCQRLGPKELNLSLLNEQFLQYRRAAQAKEDPSDLRVESGTLR